MKFLHSFSVVYEAQEGGLEKVYLQPNNGDTDEDDGLNDNERDKDVV